MTRHDNHDEAATAAAIEQLTPMVHADDIRQMRAIVDETVSQVTTHHSGPLPQAHELAAYREIDNSFAERIVRMAEKEQERRHGLPSEILDREYRLKSRGQHYGFAVVIVVLFFAGVLAWLGNTEMAGKVAIGTLIGLVSVFVGGRAIDALGDRKDEWD